MDPMGLFFSCFVPDLFHMLIVISHKAPDAFQAEKRKEVEAKLAEEEKVRQERRLSRWAFFTRGAGSRGRWNSNQKWLKFSVWYCRMRMQSLVFYHDISWYIMIYLLFIISSNNRTFLVGGLEHVLLFHILGIIIPTDFHIFQRGRYTTNQICIQVQTRLHSRPGDLTVETVEVFCYAEAAPGKAGAKSNGSVASRRGEVCCLATASRCEPTIQQQCEKSSHPLASPRFGFANVQFVYHPKARLW